MGYPRGGTRRYDEDYYDMRDAFHMYYMDIKGDTVERMTEDLLPSTKKYVIDSRRTSDGKKKKRQIEKSSPACWPSARRRSSCLPPGRGSRAGMSGFGQQFIPVSAAVL